MIKWFIYLGSKKLTEVYFNLDCNKEYVKESLINHDGYPSNITLNREVFNYNV